MRISLNYIITHSCEYDTRGSDEEPEICVLPVATLVHIKPFPINTQSINNH